jgi:hypothetical protein
MWQLAAHCDFACIWLALSLDAFVESTFLFEPEPVRAPAGRQPDNPQITTGDQLHG